MLELQDVTKRFGTVEAVAGITFTVREGEIVGFLGPNGAGKTTTMRILAGYLPPRRARCASRVIDSAARAARVPAGASATSPSTRRSIPR